MDLRWWERCQHWKRRQATTTGLSTYSLYCNSYHFCKLNGESHIFKVSNVFWDEIFTLFELISELLPYLKWFPHIQARHETDDRLYFIPLQLWSLKLETEQIYCIIFDFPYGQEENQDLGCILYLIRVWSSFPVKPLPSFELQIAATSDSCAPILANC